MCTDPATAMAIANAASTALAAAGTVMTGMQQFRAAKDRERVAEMNQKRAAEAANDSLIRGKEEADKERQRRSLQIGAARAAMAAGGIDADFGSAVTFIDDAELAASQDSQTILKNAERESRGYDIESYNEGFKARAAKRDKKFAVVNSALKLGSTVLGGVQQHKKIQAEFG